MEGQGSQGSLARQRILDNIIDILDQNHQPIQIDSLILEFSCNKYSSKKNNIYHMTLNDKHLSKRDTYQFKYKCVSCDSVHIVGTTQFLRKVNKCSYRCNLCCNQEETKREQHSISSTIKEPIKKSLIEQQADSIIAFNEYDDDFKENYFRSHLTEDDYIRISKNIVSLQNGQYDPQTLEYWPIFKTNNQMLFTSVFYDRANDLVIKANQPIMRCANSENCNNEWRAKLLERYKNHHKILCADCTFCNKTFKIRTTQNNIRESILYQSQLEMKFIRWCNAHNITVINGAIIPYVFQNKMHKYKVDFQINDILIEIKDNKKIESGKWQAKQDAINEELAKGSFKEYLLITPKNWIHMLNKLQMLNKI